jgi:Mg2+/Co2+ transporter CorC
MIETFALLAVVTVLLLIAVNAVSITLPTTSQFELERRHQAGDKKSLVLLRKTNAYGELVSVQRIVSSLLLVMSVALLVAASGWLIGLFLSTVLALEYGALARCSFVRSHVQKQYDKYEDELVKYIQAHPKLFSLMRMVTTDPVEARIGSKQELLHLISSDNQVLSRDEKSLVQNGLSFEERKVRDIMTPRSVIDTVGKEEVLGPLVLDDLHKTGHSRFVVIDGDLDHTVGILHVRSLLNLDAHKKKTQKVEQAMEPCVLYIREDQTLSHALAAFLRTHHHLFVVVNEYRETVGLLSLEDVIEAMLGREIVDEFDAHEDLREVAARNPRGNNSAKDSLSV